MARGQRRMPGEGVVDRRAHADRMAELEARANHMFGGMPSGVDRPLLQPGGVIRLGDSPRDSGARPLPGGSTMELGSFVGKLDPTTGRSGSVFMNPETGFTDKKGMQDIEYADASDRYRRALEKMMVQHLPEAEGKPEYPEGEGWPDSPEAPKGTAPSVNIPSNLDARSAHDAIAAKGWNPDQPLYMEFQGRMEPVAVGGPMSTHIDETIKRQPGDEPQSPVRPSSPKAAAVQEESDRKNAQMRRQTERLNRLVENNPRVQRAHAEARVKNALRNADPVTGVVKG